MAEYRAPILLSALVAGAAVAPLLFVAQAPDVRPTMRFEQPLRQASVQATYAVHRPINLNPRRPLALGLAEMARREGLPHNFALREDAQGETTTVVVLDTDSGKQVGTIHWVTDAPSRVDMDAANLEDMSLKSESLAAAVRAVFETDLLASVPRGQVIQWQAADKGQYKFASTDDRGWDLSVYSDGGPHPLLIGYQS